MPWMWLVTPGAAMTDISTSGPSRSSFARSCVNIFFSFVCVSNPKPCNRRGAVCATPLSSLETDLFSSPEPNDLDGAPMPAVRCRRDDGHVVDLHVPCRSPRRGVFSKQLQFDVVVKLFRCQVAVQD